MRQQVNNGFYELSQLSKDFEDKSLKPSEVTQFYLERISEQDSKIKAFESIYFESALRAARLADDQILKGNWKGPFHGIPFVLKDICDFKGHITTCGSALYKNRVSTSTATIVQRLIKAGGILLGKTKTVEFAFGGWGTNQFMGTPWNPWDKENHRVCGGSSAGSAAAVASNMACCAIGTDTGGSVRLPSAFCGLTGLKVGKSRLPTDGIMPLSHTLDTPGPMARSVNDVTIMFEALLGAAGKKFGDKIANARHKENFFKKGNRMLCLGVIDQKARSVCSSAVLNQYDKVIKSLSDFGLSIKTFKSPFDFFNISEKMSDLIAVEAYQHHGHLYENELNPVDEDVRQRVLKVKDYPKARYLDLLSDRHKDQDVFYDYFDRFDALITPTTMDSAPLLCDVDQAVSPGYFTRPANYFDMCALSLPMGLNRNGLPLSLQISVRPECEITAILIGAGIERVRDNF